MAVTETTSACPASKGLKVGALGLLGSIVVGVASTAPAYGLAASLGYVVVVPNGDGIVGVKAPLVMIPAFIPMYFIAVAYAELNRAEPDCGSTFTWAVRPGDQAQPVVAGLRLPDSVGGTLLAPDLSNLPGRDGCRPGDRPRDPPRAGAALRRRDPGGDRGARPDRRAALGPLVDR